MNPHIFALTIASFSLEITSRGSLIVRLGGREVFLSWGGKGQPFSLFSKVTTDMGTEFWGLGFSGVTNRV